MSQAPAQRNPLVLVSNRGPVTFHAGGEVQRGSGGLVTALTGLASAAGRHGTGRPASASASPSKSSTPSWTAATPSTIAWWTLPSTAARRP